MIQFSLTVDKERWLRGHKRNRTKMIKMRKASALSMARSIQANAQLNLMSRISIDTDSQGDLVNSIRMQATPNGAYVKVASPHAIFVEKGTGIYAADGNGRKTPWIYEHRSWGRTVTWGQAPKYYMRDAIASTNLNSTKILRGVWRTIGV